MINNDILGCLRIQFSYNTNYLTQSFVESRYFSEILKRQSKYVRNSSSTMVIEQYWAWFNQSIGEGVHGETYRIAGIQLEEWKKRGHRHGISQNLTKERGNNVLLLFFLKMFLSWPRRKGVGKWNNIFWKDRRFQDSRKVIFFQGKMCMFPSNTKTSRCGCGVKISNTGTTNVGDVYYWPSIFGIPKKMTHDFHVAVHKKTG